MKKSNLEPKSDEHLQQYMGTIKTWAGQYYKKGLCEFEDCLQEGFMVYLKACDLYDPKRKVKFNTFLNMLLRNRMYDMMKEDNQDAIVFSLDEPLFSDEEDGSYLSRVKSSYVYLDNDFVHLIYKGYSLRELSEILNVHRKTVTKRLEEDRKKYEDLDLHIDIIK